VFYKYSENIYFSYIIWKNAYVDRKRERERERERERKREKKGKRDSMKDLYEHFYGDAELFSKIIRRYACSAI